MTVTGTRQKEHRESGSDVPPVPEGWERRHPGRPLLDHQEKEKVRLQWCPKCGPRRRFAIDTKIDVHIASHHPEDFGLGQIRSGIMGYVEEGSE